MPKVTDMIQSKFLRQSDIEGEVLVTIKSVAHEEMAGPGAEKRWTLAFCELPKAMVLNATTIRVLEKAYGSDTDSWLGQKVTLYVDPNVSFQGRVVGGLRLRPAKAIKQAKAAPPFRGSTDEVPY